MRKHGIADPDGEDQLGHDVKNNDMTTATCEVMSILQPYPQEPITVFSGSSY